MASGQNSYKSLAKNLLAQLPEGWRAHLSETMKQPYFAELMRFLEAQMHAGKKIHPAPEHIFEAFKKVDLQEVHVVILGQDPYHGAGQAIGLSFAVPNTLTKKPPSLKNIFKELQSDLSVKWNSRDSDFSGWVEQGVLLLNTVLTVEEGKAYSHQDHGWEKFTNEVIACLNARKEPIVFILWGSHAQKFKSQLDLKKHRAIESAHPSPLSAHRGFLGSKVFSRTNGLLIHLNKKPIRWERVTIP